MPRSVYKKDSELSTEIHLAPWGRDKSLEGRKVTFMEYENFKRNESSWIRVNKKFK